ncbi:MAG: ribosomal L7Ae/L30e/S12e/Gadd45 family protein [Clostridia bacterium]|nr:ribosomal L7Ae/L30e/S12e/Gadd45 family protein [Clostridia bacterium]
MMNNNLNGLLGLCRKACKMSIGHDAVIGSIKQGKSKLAITCSDASPRLKKEIFDECTFNNRNIRFIDAPFTMSELGFAIGKKAGVISIDEEGFANKLYSIITGGYEYGD